MTIEAGAMMGAGVAALAAGLALAQTRVATASGAGKLLALGPVFVSTALAIFAAEHFFAARELMAIVPHWLPAPLFWTYFFGGALLAASISFIVWKYVRWSAALLALFFLLIVATVDLPNLSGAAHNRIFWVLAVRELAFASGAMVLAGSGWPRENPAGMVLMQLGRAIVGAIMVFYAVEHFVFPRNVPGVPLEKLTPAWVPAPVLLAYVVGVVLLLGGIGLFIRPTIRIAAAGAGTVLVLLTAFFYVPILVMEFHSALVVEGINYVGDTLLFAGTVMLAGLGAERREVREPLAFVVSHPFAKKRRKDGARKIGST